MRASIVGGSSAEALSEFEALLLVESASLVAKKEVEREQAHKYDCVVAA